MTARRSKPGRRRRTRSNTRMHRDSKAASFPTELAADIAIENVYPEVDGGRFPVKRTVGDVFEVWADICKPGHDVIRASVKYRRKGESAWNETPMHHYDNDRWTGRFTLEENTRYEYTIEAWTDRFATLMRGVEKWVDTGEDVSADLADAYRMIEKARTKAGGQDRLQISSYLERMSGAENQRESIRIALDPEIMGLVAEHQEKDDVVTYKVLEVVVERVRARFAAWYEMFHRSQGTTPGRSATFKDCEARLPEIHRMGFDVVYLPPIHPIGHTNRKGPNNSPVAGPDDPGSPWAIGSEEGGHTSIHPDLGTMEDFLHFVDAAGQLGMEVALDLAFQCSPDHPYVREHPEWFFRRGDGTIRYAENPPKRYQDTYPLFFGSGNWKELWEELSRVVLFWIEKGVKSFRVDNPHTKPPGFWEWLIRKVQESHPETIFLAEAFTRPKIMRYLAKLGFTQSYTYFTWKNSKWELTEFLSEFFLSDIAEYYRGNLFTNTPDILTAYLQKGGRPAFKIRLVLAATLSSAYGIYNGYELCENTAKAPKSEEYLNSEKYQYKVWDWDRPGNIKDFIAKVNQIRRENPALHESRNLRLLHADNDSIFFYGKWTRSKDNIILVAVNLNPFDTHESTVFVPIHELGIEPWQTYEVHDLITDTRYGWKGEANYVRLDPNIEPAHILLLKE